MEEYKASIHYQNAIGVRAGCSDCHMPQEISGQIVRKIQASNDVYQHFITKAIDTPELYEDKRLEMAQRVWNRMENNDSSSCRSCHSYEAMDHKLQSVTAAKQMKEAATDNQTCISCHKGIAHEMPDMSGGYRKAYKELEKEAAEPVKSEKLFSLTEMPMYKNREASKSVGKLLPATEIKVLDRSDDMLNIEITGWRDTKGRGRVLTTEAGKRIFAATLKGSQARKVDVLESVTVGDANRRWERVSTSVWIRNENLLGDIKPIWEYSEELYLGTCTQCHGAPDVDHFSSTEWIAQLKGMMSFVDMNKREERTLLKYLQTHGADSAGNKAH